VLAGIEDVSDFAKISVGGADVHLRFGHRITLDLVQGLMQNVLLSDLGCALLSREQASTGRSMACLLLFCGLSGLKPTASVADRFAYRV
jgi:hypothetical protein